MASKHIQAIQELHAKGYSQLEISKQLKINKMAVSRALVARGVSSNRSTPPIHLDPRKHVRTLTPPAILNTPPIDPMSYYVTSGEAILKTNQLIIEIRDCIPLILKQLDTEEIRKFAIEVHAALVEARKFREHLIMARGPATLLECYPEGGSVLFRRTDPRGVQT